MRYVKYREKLCQCHSAVLMDVLDAMGIRIQCMKPSIRPLTPSMKAWGEAVTIRLETVTQPPEHPYQLEMEVIDDLREGDLIVAQCDGPQLSAFWGGLLTNAALGHKAAGVVTDGGSRDHDEIVSLGFPVFCGGLTPYDSLGRVDGNERDVRITCGGIWVSPGDLVYADVDGVVVVPQGIAAEAIAKAWEKVQGESKVREELRAGASVVKTFAKYGIL